MIRGLALLLAVCLLASAGSAALPFLHAEGTRLADDRDRTVVLKGVALGSWLMIEPWISNIDWGELGGGPLNETPLYETLTHRFGTEGREKLLDAYRENWVSAEDVRKVKAMGFNALRVPVSYRLLEEDGAPFVYKESGWRFLDRAVDWCREFELYCILDLHRPPGGQTGLGISEADFWTNETDQARTEALWRAIALRYRDRPEVAGYDLLNEPVAAPSPEALARAYDRLYRAVRSADPNRTLFLEPPIPFGGPEQLPDPRSRGWENVAYSYHPYAAVRGFLPVFGLGWMRWFGFPPWTEAQRRWQVPVFAGEVHCVGVDVTAAPGLLNGDLGACLDGLLGDLEGNGWSWSFWTVKYVRGIPGSLYGVQTLEVPGKAHLATDTYGDLLQKFEAFNSSRGAFTPKELERVLSDHLRSAG